MAANTDYGRGQSCTDSVHLGRQSTGIQLLGEALYRRFITPEGTLHGGPEEEEYGFDLSGQVGKSTAHLPTLPSRIEAEALKDERVSSATATVTSTTTPNGLAALDVVIECESADGPFQLHMLASQFSNVLVGITPR